MYILYSTIDGSVVTYDKNLPYLNNYRDTLVTRGRSGLTESDFAIKNIFDVEVAV